MSKLVIFLRSVLHNTVLQLTFSSVMSVSNKYCYLFMLRLTIVCRDAIQVTRMERSFCCSWSGDAWRLRLYEETTYIIPSDTQDWISDVNLLSCPSGCSILLPWSRTRQGRWTGQPYQRSLLPLCSWWPTFRQQKGLLEFLPGKSCHKVWYYITTPT